MWYSFHAGGCGEIGRRARFRFWFLTEWGFKSSHPHETDVAEQADAMDSKSIVRKDIQVRFLSSVLEII